MKRLGTTYHKEFGVANFPGPIVGKHGNTTLNEDQGRMRRWRRVGVEAVDEMSKSM